MSRVTDIRYIGYGVTAFEAEREFYVSNWGLQEVQATQDIAWLRTVAGNEPCAVRLRRAEVNHLDLIAFAAADRDAVAALHDKVIAAGCRIVHGPQALQSPGGGFGFRCFSPDGLPIEISCDVTPAPGRSVDRWEGIPLQISHIVLHSPNVAGAVQFFTDTLGFRVSDWLGDFMCFLRCNSAHHRLAILPGPPCLNHVAYDMTDVDGMMRGISRLRQTGVEINWGPGRHTAGDNTFSYFVTPAGFVAEYTAELEEVDFEQHQATVHVPAPRVMDQWGVGVGGPQTLPHAHPDARLFQPAPV